MTKVRYVTALAGLTLCAPVCAFQATYDHFDTGRTKSQVWKDPPLLRFCQGRVGGSYVLDPLAMMSSSSGQSSKIREDVTMPQVPSNFLGPSPQLRSLAVRESISAFRRRSNDVQNITITRLAQDPDMFSIRNFLSVEECQTIQDEARSKGGAPAETITDGDTTSRPNSLVTWLSPGDQTSKCSPILQSLSSAIAGLLLSPDLLRYSASSNDHRLGVEDVQIVHYRENGEFVLHVDGPPRILTVLYYLNGVGGTWFPLADISGSTSRPRPTNKQHAMDLSMEMKRNLNGVLVSGKGENKTANSVRIAAGDAIAFYNYVSEDHTDSPRINWNALHAGLPVKFTDGSTGKWIANHWIRLN